MSALTELIQEISKYEPTSEKYPIDVILPISKQLDLKAQIVKRGIDQRCLTVDNKTIVTSTIYVAKGQEVRFQNEAIELPIPNSESKFDKFISLVLTRLFDGTNYDSLSLNQKNNFYAIVVEYFAALDYDVNDLGKSLYNQKVLAGLEEFEKRNFSSLSNGRHLKKKELVENLISYRSLEYDSFDKLVKNIIEENYDLNSNDLFQDFSRLFNRKAFTFLVKPLLSYNLDSIKIFERVVRNYKSILNADSANEKIELRSASFKEFLSIEHLISSDKDDKLYKGFKKVIGYFKIKCNEAIGFQDTGEADVQIRPDNRTYNFENIPIYIHAYIENVGTGIAKNIKLSVRDKDDIFLESQLIADILTPKEGRMIKFKVQDLSQMPEDHEEKLTIKLRLQWNNDFGNSSESETIDFTIVEQKKELPWEELRRSKPYDIVIVDDPNKLFGRDKFIEDLRWNIEKSNNISSYIIYGQKRVGKSSIVKTLETIYKDNENVIFIYKVIADVKNVDANRTFLQIGETISKILKSEFRHKTRLKESQLPNLNDFSFNGSLSPLIDLIEEMRYLNNKLRIVIALDEFDELNREFFDNGELGKTFALNIGKGLNVKTHIGFILIGSENMVSQKIQGMRLNTFEIKKVDTFDKTNEYGEYCKIITQPTKSCLVFAPAVLDYLYYYTNGNPYFTNMICSKIFLKAFDKKISYIDLDFANEIINHMVKEDLSAKDFEHFWKDGLPEDHNYEKELDKRKRLLTAFVQTKLENKCDWNGIKRKIKYPKKYQISESQMEDTLNEFKQRKIIQDGNSDCLEIVPKLFEEWLLQSGLYQIIVTLEDKDEILDKVLQEQKLFVSDDELSVISNILEDSATKTQVTNLRSFIDQFEDNANKRWIADILKKMIVVSSSEIMAYLKKVRKDIWNTIEVATDEYNLRKDAEIFSFSDSYEQNKHYAELIKKTFQLSNRTIKQFKDLTSIDTSTKNLIIYEPLIDCPYFYRNELSIFLKKIKPTLVRELNIHILCFIISDEAKIAIEELLSTCFNFDYKIHALKLLQRSEISPFYNNTESINNPTFKALSRFDKDLSDDACLVKIGQLIPYQSFPILWCSEIPKFMPLYNSGVKLSIHKIRMDMSVALRNLKFESETDKIEFKASFSEPAFNWKKINNIAKALKKVPDTKIDDIISLNKMLEGLFSLKLSGVERTTTIHAIKHSIAKNISAFANSNGGEIYIGIEDDFTIQGLIYDRQALKNQEDIRRAFSELIEKYIGIENATAFTLDFIQLPNATEVLRVSVSKLENEVWVKTNEDGFKLSDDHRELYIREHHGAKQLFTQQYFEWKNNKTRYKN